MKKLLLAIILCLPAIVFQSHDARAQTATATTPHRNSMTGFDYLIPCRNPRPSAKTTSDNAARVISVTNLKYDGTTYVPTDSSALIYGTGRGSAYSANDFTAINYDMAISYEYTGTAYNNYIKSSQTFDASNNVQAYTEQAWIPWLANWRNDYQELYTYDAMRNLLTVTSQAWDTSAMTWVNSTKGTNTYTSANKLATSVQESWNSTTSIWENGYRSTNGYDASNLPVNSISEVWNLTTSTWDSAYRINYQNNAMGYINMETAQSYDMTFHSWINVSRYSYTYDGSNRLLTELYETWDVPTTTWLNSSMNVYSGYVGSNAASIVYQSWDGGTTTFVNSNRDNYAFNSFEQPTLIYNETWDASTSTWMRVANLNFGQRFTYESYVSALHHTASIIGKASIYPVPAKDAISIDITWDEPQAFAISITDLLGHTVASRDVPETGNYTATWPVSDLAAGNYIVKIEGAKGKLIRRLVVEK